MSHIFAEKGEGTSEKNLSDAMANAIHAALKEHRFDGDHQISMTIIVEGYVFYGEKYRVKLRVMIFDYTEAQSDYYRDLKKRHHDLEETQDMVNQYYVAAYGLSRFNNRIDYISLQIQNILQYNEALPNIYETDIIASGAFHYQMAVEQEFIPDMKPLRHTDFAELTLGAGSGSGADAKFKDKAA